MKFTTLTLASMLCCAGVAYADGPEPTPAYFDAQLRNNAPPHSGETAQPAQTAQSEHADPASAHGCPDGQVWVADDGQGQPGDGLDHSGCFPGKVTAGFNLGSRNTTSKTTAQQIARNTDRAPPRAPDLRGHFANLSITFYTGSAKLTPEAQKYAQAFAATLAMPQWKDKRLEIDGYTDAVGSPEANLALSRRRAEAVRAYLIAHGADPSKLGAQGFGSKDLAVPDNPGAEANRRVMARVLD